MQGVASAAPFQAAPFRRSGGDGCRWGRMSPSPRQSPLLAAVLGAGECSDEIEAPLASQLHWPLASQHLPVVASPSDNQDVWSRRWWDELSCIRPRGSLEMSGQLKFLQDSMLKGLKLPTHKKNQLR